MAHQSVIELRQKLFKRMGLDAPGPNKETRSRHKPGAKGLSLRDQRNTEMTQKQTQRYSRKAKATRPTDDVNRAKREALLESDAEDVGSSEDESEGAQRQPPFSASHEPKGGNGVSKLFREKLAQDDAEIEALERKLGIKKNRKSLPKALQDDGLGDILANADRAFSESQDKSSKRTRDFDDWLSSKRRKSASNPDYNSQRHGDDRKKISCETEFLIGSDENGMNSGKEGAETHICYDCESDGGDSSDQSFDGLELDGGFGQSIQPRQRENPYIAPTTGVVVAKYIPPSRRMAPAAGNEIRDRLRKQILGQTNRLTDSNILSIVHSIDGILQHHARGDVTELLTDAIMAQVCRPESLPDQFFVLIGGFSAAIYKIIGLSFGSHLVRRVVQDFRGAYEKANQETDDQGFHRKETSNLITFLSQLYVFEVLGCRILFDYMERLLQVLSEVNVELLVRVCRTAGRLLRRDNSQALKHVSGALGKAVSKVGYASVSARTKFMVDIINDLKNGKQKAKGVDSTIVSEHVLRMRKRLGELKSQSRRFDGLAAMGMSLHDIESADSHGEWLVGASVPAYRGASESARQLVKERNGGESDSTDEDMDFVLPDYPNKARAQGLNTAAQIAIFTALMSANGHEQGYQQYTRLKLKKDEQLEIARVLVQCVGSETHYNEYYGLVGSLACSNGRLRFAFQDHLWRLFRGLGESLFGEGGDEEETADNERMKNERRVGHVARFYASLVGQGALTISVLKPLELPELNQRTAAFVECFMVSLLQRCRGKRAFEDVSIEKVFGPARELPSFAAGIYWFLDSKVRRSKLVEAEGLARVREKARAVVQGATANEL